jgi:hypothetical protein
MAWNGKFEGNLKDRADKPNHKGDIRREYCSQFKTTQLRIENKDVQMAYHHISDWAMLRDVWNRLIDDKHFGTICSWLYAVGFDTTNVFIDTRNDIPVKDGKQTPAAITMAIMKGEEVEKVADVGEIHERVTWSTWNLVEGPEGAIRTDDRGNFHDIFSTVKKGITDKEKADLQAADRVYGALSALNTSGPIDKDRALALGKALLAVNRNAQVIKYREDMWVCNKSLGKKCWTKNLA